jgi:hypothetical protein
MTERRDIPEPGELVYAPRPSWAPAFFALGVAGLLAGIYADGFLFPAWVYAVAGLAFVLGALRSLVKGATRDYFRLPRRQRVRGAVLPVETISASQD